MSTLEELWQLEKREFEGSSDTLRSRLLWWLKAPCKQEDCYAKLKYRHLTCLTCPHRRLRQKGDKSGFTRYKRALMVLESVSGRGFIMPKHYRTYGLIIKTNEDREVPLWKQIPLKILLTIAERVAEW